MPENTHKVACFLRVDVALDGGRGPEEMYDALSERLQNLVAAAAVRPSAEGSTISVQDTRCVVLGPLEDHETIEAGVDMAVRPAEVGAGRVPRSDTGLTLDYRWWLRTFCE